MKRKQYTTHIHAPRTTVWHAMLDDAPYRDWTSVFAEGSHFVGEWKEGSRMHFLAPGEDGSTGGMISRIAACRPPEFVSIQHLGTVANGVEVTDNPEYAAWAGAEENYTFTDVDGVTEVRVDIDLVETEIPFFDEAWPRALARLKAIAEGTVGPT